MKISQPFFCLNLSRTESKEELMKEQNLEYNKSFIDTVDSLCGVNHRILISKCGERVKIKSNNLPSSFCYIIDAPLSFFNMPCNQVGLIDFTRFERFYDAMSSKTVPASLSLNLDDENEAVEMIFKNETRSDKLTLRLGDTSLPTFDASFNELAENSKDVTLELDEDTINELQKKISIIGADYIDVDANENVLNFNIYTMRSADRADYPIFLNTPASKNFHLKFTAETLNLLPKGKYNLEVDAEGCLSLYQIREDDIKVQIALLAED